MNLAAMSIILSLLAVRQGADVPHARLEESTVVLQPAGISFQIPKSVSDGPQTRQFTAYLSKTELERAKRPASDEWDRSYSLTVNTVLPFEACLAHIGTEPFGAEGRRFSDLQMRAYLIDGPMKSVLDKVVNAGVPSTLGNFHSIKRTPAQNVKGWSQVTMTATMIADDYVGFPAIDFYVRQFGQRTMVLVFMYSPGPDPWTASIADIVESVKVGK